MSDFLLKTIIERTDQADMARFTQRNRKIEQDQNSDLSHIRPRRAKPEENQCAVDSPARPSACLPGSGTSSGAGSEGVSVGSDENPCCSGDELD